MAKITGILVVTLSVVSFALAGDLGTSFTYQGQLDESGAPAAGSFDMEFRLYDSLDGGAQVGGTQTESGIVVVDGYFDVELDFGAGVFSGEELWLAVSVRQSGVGEFVPLTPRQPVTPAPYSLHAIDADTLDGFQGDDLLDRVTYDPDGDGIVAGADIATTAVDAGTVDGFEGADFVQKSGGTMSGTLTLASDPQSSLEAATKQYVDSASESGMGLHGIYSDKSATSTQSKTPFLLHSTTIPGGSCPDEIMVFVRGQVQRYYNWDANINSSSTVQMVVNSSILDNANGGGTANYADNFTLVSLLDSSQEDLSEDVLVEIFGWITQATGAAATSASYSGLTILCR